MDLNRQVACLERQLRWTRRAIVALVLPVLGVAFIAAGPQTSPGILTAREIRVVDSEGRTVVKLAAREGDGLGGLETYWPSGRVAFSTFSGTAGRSSVAAPPNAPDGTFLKSRIDGQFEGWDGDTIVKLTDGSIWRQIDLTLELRLAYNPEVLVLAKNGRYEMLVDGCRKAVSVERLK